MNLLIKNIIVMVRVDTKSGYKYKRKIIPINRVMTEKELKQLQKVTAAKYKVKMNMVGGVVEQIN